MMAPLGRPLLLSVEAPTRDTEHGGAFLSQHTLILLIKSPDESFRPNSNFE